MSEAKWEKRLNKLVDAGYADDLNDAEISEFTIICSYFGEHYPDQFGLFPAAEEPGLRLEQHQGRKHIIVEVINREESNFPIFDIMFFDFENDIQKFTECEGIFDSIAFLHQLK
jgi:hypothetical protein